MTHALLADVLGPFGADERVAALAAGSETPGSNGMGPLDDIERHGSLPIPSLVEVSIAGLWHERDRGTLPNRCCSATNIAVAFPALVGGRARSTHALRRRHRGLTAADEIVDEVLIGAPFLDTVARSSNGLGLSGSGRKQVRSVRTDLDIRDRGAMHATSAVTPL